MNPLSKETGITLVIHLLWNNLCPQRENIESWNLTLVHVSVFFSARSWHGCRKHMLCGEWPQENVMGIAWNSNPICSPRWRGRTFWHSWTFVFPLHGLLKIATIHCSNLGHCRPLICLWTLAHGVKHTYSGVFLQIALCLWVSFWSPGVLPGPSPCSTILQFTYYCLLLIASELFQLWDYYKENCYEAVF